MPKRSSRDSRLIETEAIIVAYAMSRLDRAFLARFRLRSWHAAFLGIGGKLGVAPASMKNLRDEFDPVHGFRKGWHKRPLRPNRHRVLAEFSEMSDDALLEVVERLIRGDAETRDEIVRPLSLERERLQNVAERLRTGRLAEEYFMTHSQTICGVLPAELRDRRNEAAGFDFAVAHDSALAIEVKGLKPSRGAILFTDLEWRTARIRGDNYWLIIVGKVIDAPIAKLWRNPAASMKPTLSVRRSAVMSWHANVSVA